MGPALDLPANELSRGDAAILSPPSCVIMNWWMDGALQAAGIYDRTRCCAGDIIKGPAIVVEMDSTTLIETRHLGTVDG